MRYYAHLLPTHNVFKSFLLKRSSKKICVLNAILFACMMLMAVFKVISVISRRPVNLLMLPSNSLDKYSDEYSFQASYWLLSNKTMSETKDIGERAMHYVAMTIINPSKELWPSRGWNRRPSLFKSSTLPTELRESGDRVVKDQSINQSINQSSGGITLLPIQKARTTHFRPLIYRLSRNRLRAIRFWPLVPRLS